MKDAVVNLLIELLKDSKRSDRELAKVLGVSQPSVSRMRNKLVKDGYIQQFTVIPDLAKMGFEILAICSFKSKKSGEMGQRTRKWTMSKSNVLFAARAEGIGKNVLVVSIHKNYTDFSNFLSDVMMEGTGIIEDYDTLLVSLKGLIIKPFSLKYLADLLKTSNEETQSLTINQ